MNTTNRVAIISGGAGKGFIDKLRGGAARSVFDEVDTEYRPVGVVSDILRAGGYADIILTTEVQIRWLAQDRLVLDREAVLIGGVATGVACKLGVQEPSTLDEDGVRKMFEACDALYVPDIDKSTAGRHVKKILAEMGIDGSVAKKLRTFADGSAAMAALAQHGTRKSLGCTQVTEIRDTRGVTLIGDLPDRIGLVTDYYAVPTPAGAAKKTVGKILEAFSASEFLAYKTEAGFVV